MKYRYEISGRSAELGSGWKLTLLEDGQEVGGGVFPVPAEDPQVGMDWWNASSEERRAHWMMMSDPPTPASARHVYLLSEAYNNALDEAAAWMSKRA